MITNSLLTSGDFQQRIHDPEVAAWVLDRLQDKRDARAPDAAALEQKLFDEATVRRFLDRPESGVLARLLGFLSVDCFRPVAAKLIECWPAWQGYPAGAAAPVMAEIAPDDAVATFRAYIEKNPLWDDIDKTIGVCRALGSIRAEASRSLAREIVEKIEPWGDALAIPVDVVARIHLAWPHDLLTVKGTLVRLITEPDMVATAEKMLEPIFGMLTDKSPLFQQIVDLQSGETKQNFAELAPFFDAGAPLDELDRLVVGVEVINLGESSVFAGTRCEERDYLPLKLACTCMAEASGKVQSKLEALWGTFLLAVGAASWLRPTNDFSAVPFDECVRIVSSDISRIPGYDALLARLGECPVEQAFQLVSKRLPEVENEFGTAHLVRLMGDLQHDAFLPLLFALVDDETLTMDRLPELRALACFGGRAERAIIESWEELDSRQKATRLDILERIQGEATVPLLVRCFPEMDSSDYLDSWCNTAIAVPDPRLLEVLESELPRAISLIDATFLEICTVLGVDHEALPAVREREERREQIRQGDGLWMEEAASGVLRLELECTACRNAETYKVENVCLSPEVDDPSPYIADEIACRSCGALDTLRVTHTGMAKLMAEMFRYSTALKSDNSAASALRIVTARLADGRLMSMRQAIENYRGLIREKPDSLVDHLCLGNCYSKVGRVRQAEEQYRCCLGIDLACPEAAYELAEILVDVRKTNEAFRVLDTTLKHKKRWRFYRLADATPSEFTDAYLEFHAAVSPRRILDALVYDELPAIERSERILPNEPCPCGSGKKYKKCCGRIV